MRFDERCELLEVDQYLQCEDCDCLDICAKYYEQIVCEDCYLFKNCERKNNKKEIKKWLRENSK